MGSQKQIFSFAFRPGKCRKILHFWVIFRFVDCIFYKDLARHILEEAQPTGRGTAGPEPTLSALQNHQVERLVFDGRFQAHGWRCSKCGFLGMGGLPGACPLCQGVALPVELREDIVLKAQAQGVELFFTEKFSPLVKVGGVAALFKFKISSGTRKQSSR